MRYRDLRLGGFDTDAGSAAPTFGFKMTDFYPENYENSWDFVKAYHVKAEADMKQLEQAIVRVHEKKLQHVAIEAVHRKHVQFFPEETIETIIKICSEQFQTVGSKVEPYQRGIAYSVENALAARPTRHIDTINEAGEKVKKTAIVAYRTPIEFLNMICHVMAKNILRRLKDTETELAVLLIKTYLGDSMPLTISGEMIIAHKETGIEPTNDALKLQARRNPDFWQPETMQQALKKIMSGDADPQLVTLLISGEYHRNRMWFGEETAEEVVKETISTIDTSGTIKKVSQ